MHTAYLDGERILTMVMIGRFQGSIKEASQRLLSKLANLPCKHQQLCGWH